MDGRTNACIMNQLFIFVIPYLSDTQMKLSASLSFIPFHVHYPRWINFSFSIYLATIYASTGQGVGNGPVKETWGCPQGAWNN